MGLREEFAVALALAGGMALVYTAYKACNPRSGAGVYHPSASSSAAEQETTSDDSIIAGAGSLAGVDAGTTSEPSSGAGLHLSPAGGEKHPSMQPMAVDIAAPAGVLFTSPDWAPSRERFLELSHAIYRALDLTAEELPSPEDAFWDENRDYLWVLFTLRTVDAGTPLRSILRVEDPRLALEVQWTEPGTEALWRTHMRLFKQQHIGHQTNADLGLTQKRLFELRDAIWSGVSPAHQFLFRLDQETR